jgi:hypothetical protein
LTANASEEELQAAAELAQQATQIFGAGTVNIGLSDPDPMLTVQQAFNLSSRSTSA